jgi:hypothetical protein
MAEELIKVVNKKLQKAFLRYSYFNVQTIRNKS